MAQTRRFGVRQKKKKMVAIAGTNLLPCPRYCSFSRVTPMRERLNVKTQPGNSDIAPLECGRISENIFWP